MSEKVVAPYGKLSRKHTGGGSDTDHTMIFLPPSKIHDHTMEGSSMIILTADTAE